MSAISRRDVLRMGLGLGSSALALGLAGCGGGSSQGGSANLRMSWWGSQDSNKNQLAAIRQFQKEHRNFKISGEFSSYDDYWPRIATQVAGGSAPDLLLMDITHITEYAGRGVMVALDQYVGHQLDLGGYDKGARTSATVNGKLYGVARGFTTPSLAFDTVTMSKLQIPIPGDVWTWDEYATLSADIAKAAGPGFYGTEDGGGDMGWFTLWVRGRGKQLYKGASLGFTKADLTEWLSYWDSMRRTNACVPADVEALFQSKVENSPLIKGKCALQWTNSDAILGLQPLTPHELQLHVPPRADAKGKPPNYLFATSFLTCFSRSKSRDQVIEAINDLATDVAVNKAYNLESGPSPFKKVRSGVEGSLDALGKRMFDYSNLIATKYSTPAPPPPPKGWAQVVDLLTQTNQNIGFKKQSVPAAVDSFFSQASGMLSSS